MANLKNNTTTMQEILDTINALPEAGSGGVDVSGVTASPEDVMEGKIFIDSDGIEREGTLPLGEIYTPSIEVSTSGVITATTGVSKAGYLPISDLITNTKNLTTETWTVTYADGTTGTKKVVII